MVYSLTIIPNKYNWNFNCKLINSKWASVLNLDKLEWEQIKTAVS